MPLPLPTDDPNAVATPGGLYVVATPIGNLEDITLRAIKTLSSVDLIAAEDTRHTGRLLRHYHIDTPLISCHEHNEQQRTPELIDKIRDGKAVVLVTDAGTPTVSDPGYRLVRSVIDQGLEVFPIPGVSAAVTALCASGLPTDAFVFQGFTPKKKGKRGELLDDLANEPRTLVFFESPRRVTALLDDIRSAMGDRQAVLARELTKLHEEFIRGRLSEIQARLAERSQIKGECTLLVAGAPAAETISDTDLEVALRQALDQSGSHLSSLSKALARRFNLPRKRVYEMGLRVRRENEDIS
jgi:16S rRNA (cytidine1402-2'-O)-methyltransferase